MARRKGKRRNPPEPVPPREEENTAPVTFEASLLAAAHDMVEKFNVFNMALDAAHESAKLVQSTQTFYPASHFPILRNYAGKLGNALKIVSRLLDENLSGRRWDSGQVEDEAGKEDDGKDSQ